MRLLVLVVLGACAPPMEYTLAVSDRLQTVVPYIDGVPRGSMTMTYASADEADGDRHVVELRVGDRTLRSMTVVLNPFECGGGEVTSYLQTLCALDSGDLRYGSASDGRCIVDGFCRPECGALRACGAGERCTSRVTTASPLTSHLACAPVGTKYAGEACTLVDHPEGAYDNCRTNHTCIDGRCRYTCLQGDPTCPCNDPLEGYAPEVRICATAPPPQRGGRRE